MKKERALNNSILTIMMFLVIGAVLLASFLFTNESLRTDRFWISIAFFSLAVILSFVFPIYYNFVDGERKHPVPAIWGFPIAIALYDVAVVLCIVCFGLIWQIPIARYLMCHVLCLLCLSVLSAVIIMFSRFATSSENTAGVSRLRHTQYSLSLGDIRKSITKAVNADEAQTVIQHIDELTEAIKYSDPISTESVVDLDGQITNLIDLAKANSASIAVSHSPAEMLAEMESLLDELKDKVSQRSQLLITSK